MRTNDAQMLVLSALVDGPLHGYAVNTAIERMTGERLGRGSLSSALSRLHGKGLIEYLDGEGRRRPMRLTLAGREVLEGEVEALAHVAGRMFETVIPDKIAYQDRLATTDLAHSYKRAVLDALDIQPGHVVLDLGCGPGTDLGALARAASPAGMVLGIDSDPQMTRQAMTRTADLPHVDVLTADVHALPLSPCSADRVRTDRTLQHVADVPGVLAEVRRVLRPGGRFVTAEPDWDSLAVDHPDLEIARAYTRHITDRIVRNAVLGRQLPRLAEQAGFTLTSVVPVTSVFREVRAADQVLGLQRNTERAVAAGYLTRQQAERWLDHLERGCFFAAVTLYVVTAEAPAHK
ncbi:methyltransferase domain-containing protein [Streptacidiphilus neutrinimicus]|uniref:methyltransferase domain-containing protein n=1 Tax=Streptacidiphilus neutrinimicus TaxID=105420 RepID=UPI0005AAF4EA|nr:methyltransferase domain-containing protein [Streptacidiphilus neutrinimicus]